MSEEFKAIIELIGNAGGEAVTFAYWYLAVDVGVPLVIMCLFTLIVYMIYRGFKLDSDKTEAINGIDEIYENLGLEGRLAVENQRREIHEAIKELKLENARLRKQLTATELEVGI